MPIVKPDGTPYILQGKDALKSQREDNQDFEYFNKLDIEQIELAGSTIIYYPAYIDTDFDKLYLEYTNTIRSQEGYQITAKFEPVRPLQELGAFGIDSPDEMIFNFNISQWKETIGEMPVIKSLIFTTWEKSWWQIIQKDFSEPYKLWNKYRLQVIAKKYQLSRSDIEPTRRDSDDNSINIY